MKPSVFVFQLHPIMSLIGGDGKEMPNSLLAFLTGGIAGFGGTSGGWRTGSSGKDRPGLEYGYPGLEYGYSGPNYGMGMTGRDECRGNFAWLVLRALWRDFLDESSLSLRNEWSVDAGGCCTWLT